MARSDPIERTTVSKVRPQDQPAFRACVDHGRERDAVRGKKVLHRLQLPGPCDEGIVKASRHAGRAASPCPSRRSRVVHRRTSALVSYVIHRVSEPHSTSARLNCTEPAEDVITSVRPRVERRLGSGEDRHGDQDGGGHSRGIPPSQSKRHETEHEHAGQPGICHRKERQRNRRIQAARRSARRRPRSHPGGDGPWRPPRPPATAMDSDRVSSAS